VRAQASPCPKAIAAGQPGCHPRRTNAAFSILSSVTI
jgi:hypothetical protein